MVDKPAKTASAVSATASIPELPSVPIADRFSVNLDLAIVEGLADMATSELVDVQREALRTLVNCASVDNNQQALLKHASLLPQLLTSQDEEVLRHATLLASCLCHALSSVGSVLTAESTLKLSTSMLDLLDNLWVRKTLSSLSCKRQLALGVAALSHSNPDFVRSIPSAVACLERYACSSDVETNAAVAAALDLVC